MTSASNFVGELFERTRNGRAGAVLAVSVACMTHVALASYTPDAHSVRPPMEPPLELEFVTEEPPPPPPPLPTSEPPVVEPAPRAPAAAKPVAAPAAPPPPPAAAPAVVTAKELEPAQASPDMLDFTSDPNATALSSGVVAVGGKGDRGARNASLAAPQVTSARPAVAGGGGEELTQLGDLSRKPSLGVDDPCRGFFPSGALDNSAKVSLMVVIKKDGSVKSTSLANESPAGQGFGAAAQACMKKQRFVPALDRQGQLAATAMRVNVRFNR